MMRQNCYNVLGVPRTATTGEIRAAYRRLARMYHPDLNSGPEAEARMKEINEAYDVLSDPRLRFRHDTDVAANIRQQRQNRRRRNRGGSEPSRENSPRRGEDIEVTLLISKRDAIRGARKSFPVSRMETCPRCRGAGIEPEETAQTGPCWRCGGEQRLRRDMSVKTAIPAGVAAGGRLRLRGRGNDGLDGGPNGNIYLTVRIMPRQGLRQTISFVLRLIFPG